MISVTDGIDPRHNRAPSSTERRHPICRKSSHGTCRRLPLHPKAAAYGREPVPSERQFRFRMPGLRCDRVKEQLA